MPSDFRYSGNFFEVYLLPPSVLNCFTCLPNSFSVRALHSFHQSRACDLNMNVYSSGRLMALWMKRNMYEAPPMAASSGPHRSECTSCSGSLAWKVVFRVKVFRANLHLMQQVQSHFQVILGASVIVRNVPKAFTLTCAKGRCHNIRFSASCRDARPVVISASRQLSSMSVYSVDSKARFRTNSPSTWGAVAIGLPLRLQMFRLQWFTGLTLTSLSMIWHCEMRLNNPGKCNTSWSMIVFVFPSGS